MGEQVANGDAPESIEASGYDGLQAQEVIEAAIKSHQTGQAVDVAGLRRLIGGMVTLESPSGAGWFGMIRLTYGFCSPELAREIPARIDPKLDQHAAHELNRRGRPVCARLGAAVDFIVEDEDMLEVARWVAANTPFDRLYFYGADRPIHVSYGPEQSRQVVRMVPAAGGRLVPRVVGIARFLEGGR